MTFGSSFLRYFFFSLYLQRNKNIKDTVVCHSISDSNLCERLIGNSHTQILGAPACHSSFILSFQIVTCLYFSLSIFFFHQKKRENEYLHICVRRNTCQKQLDFLLLNSIILLDCSRRDTKLPVTTSCIRKKKHRQICVHMTHI